jgi:hypothetical protein
VRRHLRPRAGTVVTTHNAADLARIKLRFPLWTFWRDAGGSAAVRGGVIMRGTTLGDLEARLTEYEHPRSLPGAFAREFAAWEVNVQPGGMDVVTAFWSSPDGRSRRFLAARSTSELLARLRAIGPVPS